MINKILLILLILITSSNLFSSELGGFAGGFLRYGLDARSESMGRSGVADGSDGFSFFYNPANIAFVTESEVMTNYRFLSMDRNFIYVGYLTPLNKNIGLKKEAVLAVGVLYAGVTDIDGRDNDGNHFGTFSFNENMFHISFSMKPKEYLSFGVTSKILYSRFPELDGNDETVSSLGIGIDVGLVYNTPFHKNLFLAVAVKDLKAKYSWNSNKVWSKGTDKNDYFPTQYEFGASWRTPFNENFLLNASTTLTSENTSLYHFGVEFSERFENDREMAFRLGTNSGQLSAGIGMIFKVYEGYNLSVDYSYTMEEISPEYDPHTLSMRLIF